MYHIRPDDTCTHPERDGIHEMYLDADDVVCRACGFVARRTTQMTRAAGLDPVRVIEYAALIGYQLVPSRIDGVAVLTGHDTRLLIPLCRESDGFSRQMMTAVHKIARHQGIDTITLIKELE